MRCLFLRDYRLFFLPVMVLLSSCGGGGGSGGGASNAFPPAGSQVYSGSASAAASTVVLTDPGKNATLTIPAGSMLAGARVGLTVWRSQRAAAQRSGFTGSAKAVDLMIDPAAMQAGASITIGLPWQAGADPIATMIVAFGASGNSTVLADTAASTPSSPVVYISASQIQYLTGSASGTQTIEVAVEQQTPPSTKAAVAPQLVKLWTRPSAPKASSRTVYASSTRIAVVVPGIFSEDPTQPTGLVTSQSYVTKVLSFLTKKLPTDGNSDISTQPFDPDEIWAYNYDYTQKIETNGAALAAAIKGKADDNGGSWGDATRFEIHIIAHSMGGIVSRWALEKVGVPAVVQLITLGSPHKGVPLSVLKELGWYGVFTDLSLLAPGIRELVDDSPLIATMQASSPVNCVQYDMVAGSSHAALYFPVLHQNIDIGYPINLLYLIVEPSAYNKNDGIIPEKSALGGRVGPRVAAGAPQPVNHDNLVKLISSYWPNVASKWLYGINRQVKTLQISPVSPTVAVGSILTLTVDAFDKDGDKLNPTLMNSAYANGIHIVWSVNNSSFATIDPNTGVLTGIARGTVIITAAVSAAQTTTGSPVSQTVTAAVTSNASNQWTVVNLNPAGSIYSAAAGVGGGQQTGSAIVGGVQQAGLWSGTAASWVDLNPRGEAAAEADGGGSSQQVGYASVAGALDVHHASLWSGTAASWVDLNPAGAAGSDAYGVSGGQQVGHAVVGGVNHASLWRGTAASWVDLSPAGAFSSEADGVSGGHQVGYAQGGGPATIYYASLWSGTAASWVNLNPAGANQGSAAYGVSGGQQVGGANVGYDAAGNIVGHASLWRGTAASWVDLNPAGSTGSSATGVYGGQQVGYSIVGGVTHAGLWRGTAASWVDLHALLPSNFSSSQASGIWNDGAHTYVVGFGVNSTTGNTEALMWVGPAP